MTPFDFTNLGSILATFVTSWLGAFIGLFSGILSLFGVETPTP